jgi:hypothetical protein
MNNGTLAWGSACIGLGKLNKNIGGIVNYYEGASCSLHETKVEHPKTNHLSFFGYFGKEDGGGNTFFCRKIVLIKNAYFSIFLFSILNFLQYFEVKCAFDPIIDL